MRTDETPAAVGWPGSVSAGGTQSNSSGSHRLDPVDTAGVLTGVLVVVVRVDGEGEHYRRRAVFSLRAAERAAERARNRGYTAEIVLCELRAIGGIR